MKRALVRVLYGEPNNVNHDYRGSRSKIDSDIINIVSNDINQDFVAYCFGKHNSDFLRSVGCKNVVMVDKNPWPIGDEPWSFLNRIHMWEYVMNDYDEIVSLDWDSVQIKPLPLDFWSVLGQKESIQSPLAEYPKKILTWRKEIRGSGRLVPNGSFVYMRDKTIPSKLMKMLDDPFLHRDIHYGRRKEVPKDLTNRKQWADEVYVAKYMDDISGGWEGKEKYYKLFEPPWTLVRHSMFKDEKKDHCFIHPRKG